MQHFVFRMEQQTDVTVRKHNRINKVSVNFFSLPSVMHLF